MMMAQERPGGHREYIFKGSGINNRPDTLPPDTSLRPEKRKKRFTGAVISLLATVSVGQAGAVYNRVLRADNTAAAMASAGINYSSIARQVAHEPDSPSPTAITNPPQNEMLPDSPKQVESPNCDEGWESLSKGVCLKELREHGSDIYAVRVDLNNPGVSVRPSFVEGPGRLGRLSDAAERLDATVGINASFFKGTRPLGPIVADGEWLHTDAFPQQVLIVHPDNTTKILSARQALNEDPAQMKLALSGSHALVRNGIATKNFGPDNAGKMLKGNHRRTAIGVNEKGELFLVVTDGLDMQELAIVMANFGVLYAVNLDGGRSSQLYAKGEIYNNPSHGSQKISTGVFVLAV